MSDTQWDTEISDQKLQAWLSERIVRLELYRYELNYIKEQIDALSHHADYLEHKGQSSPPAEAEQRERLSLAWLAKNAEIHQAFELCASHPFSIEEEMKRYCQTLIEVNERLKQHHPSKRPLRDLYNRDAEPSQAQKTGWQQLAEEARKRREEPKSETPKKPLRDLYKQGDDEYTEEQKQRDDKGKSK